MPKKRKTEAESDIDSPFSTKRARQQLSYADLDEGVEAEGVASEILSEADNDGYDPLDYDDEETSSHTTKIIRNPNGNKRQNNNSSSNSARPRVDPVYGQRSAFPGLDDVQSDELFYGPAEDGLEYLRMVRSEANSLPALFIAAKTTTQTHDGGTLGGTENQDEVIADSPTREQQRNGQDGFVLVDGVVIGTKSSATDLAPEEISSNAQSSYRSTLQLRFISLQRTLRCSPPAGAISNLDDSHPITFPYHIKGARQEWRRVLFCTDPQMVQLACMDMETVLNVLRLLSDMIPECIKGEDVAQIRRIGAWAWGLLARCRDVGELSSEEVGELRYLGRQAVNALAKLNKLESKRFSNNITALNLEDINELGDEAVPPAEATGTVTVNDSTEEIADTSMPIPTTEPLYPGERENIDELEAAKIRLQSQIRENLDWEDQELEADMAERRRRNTSSPLSDDEEPQIDQDQDLVPGESFQNTPRDSSQQARALLDMVITIVGEFYGQKDLLLQREVWQ